MLNEYYASVALEGGYADAKSPVIVQERRRPGSPPLSQQQQQEALAWARERTAQVTESLFTGRACTTCHKVTRAADGERYVAGRAGARVRRLVFRCEVHPRQARDGEVRGLP